MDNQDQLEAEVQRLAEEVNDLKYKARREPSGPRRQALLDEVKEKRNMELALMRRIREKKEQENLNLANGMAMAQRKAEINAYMRAKDNH